MKVEETQRYPTRSLALANDGYQEHTSRFNNPVFIQLNQVKNVII